MISELAQFCEHCGAVIAPNTKFCQGCGKPVSVAPPPPPRIDIPLTTYQPVDAPAINQGPSATDVKPLPQQVPEGVSGVAATPQAYMIGVYRLMRELGRGGMGVVYLALRDDGAFRKNVALKLLLRDCVNAEFISRFKQERQVLAALDHPNIARILDGGDTQDGMPYYVMEYVEGLPLDRYCDQQRLSLSARIKIFQQVCHAVDYLHQNSIVHRDLKPSNILVSSEGVVKLLDFGIAKVVGAGAWANPDLTTAQGRPMTPTYASPEQISGVTLHKTSDIYSLGAILYTLLTGRSAYNDLDDKLAKLAARELPTKPSTNIREDLRSAETTAQFRRAMMGELDSIVLKAMQIDPKDRYQSAADLAQDLQQFLDGSPVTAYHTSAAVRSVKLLKRKGALVAALCALVLLIGLGAWAFLHLQTQKSLNKTDKPAPVVASVPNASPKVPPPVTVNPPPVVVAQAQPVPVTRSVTVSRPPVQHSETLSQPQLQSPTSPPPPVVEKPAVSPETEDQLASVSSKVEIADQSIEPLRQSLQRDGQTLNAETLTRISRMHASLDRAKRAVAAGNEADAKESLAAADALATKLLNSVGR